MNLSPAVSDNRMAKTIQNNELADLFRLLNTVPPGSFFFHLRSVIPLIYMRIQTADWLNILSAVDFRTYLKKFHLVDCEWKTDTFECGLLRHNVFLNDCEENNRYSHH